MRVGEFSDMFDTMLNIYASQAPFGEAASRQEIVLDEYEKSIFLTRAQEELVLSLYNGRNSSALSFEESEELRRYLSNLIEEIRLTPVSTSNGLPLGINSNSKFFTLPDDLWFITYEAVTLSSDDSCLNNKDLEVYPARQDEYHKLKKNPFRGPNNRRALRFDLGDDNIEIVCKYTVASYYVRYIRKLHPIILIDLPDDLSINDEIGISECELHDSLHQKVLELAVRMALQSRGYMKQEQR